MGKGMNGSVPTCRKCGCTDADCSGCIERTGAPCSWVEPDLCSACADRPKPKPHIERRTVRVKGSTDPYAIRQAVAASRKLYVIHRGEKLGPIKLVDLLVFNETEGTGELWRHRISVREADVVANWFLCMGVDVEDVYDPHDARDRDQDYKLPTRKPQPEKV